MHSTGAHLPRTSTVESKTSDADAYSRLSDEKTRNGFEDVVVNDPARYKLPAESALAAIDVVKKQALVFNSIERAAEKLYLDETTIATMLVSRSRESTFSLRTRTEWKFIEVPRSKIPHHPYLAQIGTSPNRSEDNESDSSRDESDSGGSSTSISDDSTHTSDSDESSVPARKTLPGENEYVRIDSVDSPDPRNDSTFANPPSPIKEYSPDEASDELEEDDESDAYPRKRRKSSEEYVASSDFYM